MEIIQCDLEVELSAIPALQAGIAFCEAHNGYVSRELFDEILRSEEEHVNWLKTLLDLTEEMGEKNYLLSTE